MAGLEDDTILPAIRTELLISVGIRELDGSKTWTIFDPLRHKYFQIDHKNLQIINHWGDCTAGELCQRLDSFSVTLADIETLLRFLWQNALTVMPPNDNLEQFVKESTAKSAKPIKRLLHGYLFFRIPLCRPNRFLQKTEPLTRFFFTKAWWIFIVICTLVGVFLTSRQWDQFTHTFTHFFTLQGLLYYGLALVFIKCLHELGHGYAATRYGCRITTMGIAFIVMFPILFTDTTDTWKLEFRRKRMIVSSAGVAVELSLAAIATLLWAFLEDGPLRSTAFFIATTSWTMSLLINMNPLMRFDAYHFLSDALGIQNLQGRSFALGRWGMREILFGLRESAPEATTSQMRRGLILFAWATWIYRFFLFLGIAYLIYSFLHKPFGLILAGIEILFFIAIPIMKELNQWWIRRSELVTNFSSWVTATAFVALLVAFIVPWQSTIRIPAVIEASNQITLYSPGIAKVSKLHVQSGEFVEQGQLLVTLESAELDNRIIAAQRRIDLGNALLNRIAADAEGRDQKIVLDTELKQSQEELAGLQKEKSQLQISAEFDGVVTAFNPDLHQGRWVGENTRLGTLVSRSGSKIRGYLSASDLGRIDEGATAMFVPDVPELERASGVISVVETANAENLTIPELTSYYDGPIAAAKVEDDLVPLKAWYHISVDVEDQIEISMATRGTLLTEGQPESLAARFWRRAVHVVLREVFI